MKVIYHHYGLPKKIVSDGHTVFMGKFWDKVFKSLCVTISPSTVYHPKTHEQSEIVNRNIEEMM